MLQNLIKNEEKCDTELVINRFAFSSDHEFICISAEVVIEYLPLFQKLNPKKKIIGVGYTDFVFGYLPTDKQIQEGGYEGADFFSAFNLKGQFNPNIEKQVVEAVQK